MTSREKVLSVYPDAVWSSDTTIRRPVYRNNQQYGEFLGMDWDDAWSKINARTD